MRPVAKVQASPACRIGQPFAPERVYSEILEADKAACALGQPLLTQAGVSYLRELLLPPGIALTIGANGTGRSGSPPGGDLLPYWDAEARQLWLGSRLLKEFRQPAENQTALLDVFQEQGWSAHIDDPLPRAQGEGDQEGKRRLHETIKNLNSRLVPGTIRFRGDGTGQGIRWQYDRRRAAKS
jgi:hypothetical protein